VSEGNEESDEGDSDDEQPNFRPQSRSNSRKPYEVFSAGVHTLEWQVVQWWYEGGTGLWAVVGSRSQCGIRKFLGGSAVW